MNSGFIMDDYPMIDDSQFPERLQVECQAGIVTAGRYLNV